MSELTDYIKAENDKARAEMEATPGLFIGLMAEDEEFWADYGVTTVAEYERQMTIEAIVNVYKSVHGFKPRHLDVDSMSQEDLDKYLEGLGKESEAAFKEQEERDNERVEAFEASVTATIEAGAGDRETALRWLMDADGVEGDTEYFEFRNDLPYGYLRKAA